MNSINPGFLLRTLGLLFTLQGQQDASRAFMGMADSYDAGKDIDEGMRLVAAEINHFRETGEAPDWSAVIQSIRAKSDSILDA